MANLGNVIKIGKSDYDTLITNGSITKGGITYTYSDDDLYLVEGMNDVVELWRNSDPTAQFAAQNISIVGNDLGNFKYLIIEFKPQNNWKNFGTSTVVSNPFYGQTYTSTETNGDSICQLSEYITGSSNCSFYYRNVYWKNNTTLYVSAGYLSTNAGSYNHPCVPLVIYGTSDITTGSVRNDSNLTLLWENSTPSSLTGGSAVNTINSQSLDDFKYLIFEWREDGNDKGNVFTTVRNVFYGQTTVSGTNCIIRLSYTYGGGGTVGQSHRYIQRVSGSHTSFTIGKAYAGTTMNGSSTGTSTPGDCVPVRVYGSNVYNQSNNIGALAAYPIGSIYMSVNATNPGDLFGGTWQRIEGQFLLGATGDTASTATNIQKTATVGPGGQGGEAAHTLSGGEMPQHNHDTTLYYKAATATSSGAPWTLAVDSNGSSGSNSYSSNNRGSNESHNNMPPFLAVYMWKRTA